MTVACKTIHYTYDVVVGRCFGHSYIAVAQKGDGFFINSDDTMDQVHASGVFDKSDCSWLYVF